MFNVYCHTIGCKLSIVFMIARLHHINRSSIILFPVPIHLWARRLAKSSHRKRVGTTGVRLLGSWDRYQHYCNLRRRKGLTVYERSTAVSSSSEGAGSPGEKKQRHSERPETQLAGSGLESREYGRGDQLRWPCDTIYPQKLTLNSSTSRGCSVGRVRSRTKATELRYQ
jgi:hypothetical protein